MTDPLVRNWWALALRGAAALGFGLVALLHPALTVSALVAAFAAFAFADGVLAIIAALRPPGDERRAVPRRDALLLEGTLGVAIGLAAALWPDITAFALLAFVAAWAIATGACALVAAWRLRARVPGARLLGAVGAATIAFGAFLAIARWRECSPWWGGSAGTRSPRARCAWRSRSGCAATGGPDSPGGRRRARDARGVDGPPARRGLGEPRPGRAAA
jgi:uncharacterized membrane protein HdeD (DUF308 family)